MLEQERECVCFHSIYLSVVCLPVLFSAQSVVKGGQPISVNQPASQEVPVGGGGNKAEQTTIPRQQQQICRVCNGVPVCTVQCTHHWQMAMLLTTDNSNLISFHLLLLVVMMVVK